MSVAKPFHLRAVLDKLEELLGAIGNGDPKWASESTPQVIRHRTHEFKIRSYPALAIFAGPQADQIIASAGPNSLYQVRAPIFIGAWIKSDDVELAVETLAGDVRLAITEDHTLGGTVMTSEVTGCLPYDDETDKSLGGFQLTMQATWRYRAGQPGQQAG